MTVDPARRVALELERRGLAVPGRLLAEAHRPLGPLIADLGVAIGPLLGALGGPAAAGLRGLLEDERALDRVIECLEEATERHAESR